jgi:hypothetical protein
LRGLSRDRQEVNPRLRLTEAARRRGTMGALSLVAARSPREDFHHVAFVSMVLGWFRPFRRVRSVGGVQQRRQSSVRGCRVCGRIRQPIRR